MPVVVGDIVNAVINELSQVPGVATQIYSSGRILQHVQDAFLLEFEEMWWPDYMTWIGPIPLDGATGSLTADLVGPLATIREYHDIAAVHPADSNRKLRELPQSINPFAMNSGYGPWYLVPDYTTPARPFKVYPPTSTISVVVNARQRPTLPLSTADRLYLDQLLLQYDACWMYAVDDGTIPAQVNKFQVLAQNRRRMIKASFAQHPLQLDPRYSVDDMLMDGNTQSGTFTPVTIAPRPIARMQVEWPVGTFVHDGLVYLSFDPPYPGIINSVTHFCHVGSFEAVVQIAGVDVPGLDTIAPGLSTATSVAVAGTNTFAAGQPIAVSISDATPDASDAMISANVTWTG